VSAHPIGEAATAASYFVRSLERGLAVIGVLDAPEPLSLSEVARRTGLSRAAARRFVLTLEHLGYVRQSGGRFALTPRVLELGSAYLSSLTLPEIALPHIKALVEQVRESAVLSVRDDDSIVGVARVPARRIMTGTIVLGQRLPVWASASGRVLIASLPVEALDELLSRTPFEPFTAKTVASRRSCSASASRAGRSSTRSSRSACARSPGRSMIVTAASSPASHSSRRALRATSSTSNNCSCRRCSRLVRRSSATSQPVTRGSAGPPAPPTSSASAQRSARSWGHRGLPYDRAITRPQGHTK